MFARRLARRLGWDRNDMRRSSDRLEGWLTALLLLAFVVAAVWAGGATARGIYRSELRQQAWNSVHVFHVEAVLLEDPSTPGAARDAGSPLAQPVARARWTAPDGSLRTGVIQVDPEDRAGRQITTWIDDHGALSGPPEGVSPHTDATLAATGVVLCLAVLVALARRTVRTLLDRRRMRSWQQEWLEVGPRWSRRR